MTAAISSQLTKFKVGNGASPEVLLNVGEVRVIPGVGSNNPQVDVSSLDSTIREYLDGLGDGTEFTITGNRVFADAGQARLIALHVARAAGNFEIHWGNNALKKTTFSGNVQAFNEEGGVDQAVSFSATIKVTSSITRTTS